MARNNIYNSGALDDFDYNLNLTEAITIGGSPMDYFEGTIGEIIIFSRALKTEERTALEDYLGKKWGIAISR